MTGSGSGYMRGLDDEEEVQVNVKEEETTQHSRSFAIFDSPSKLRFAQKSPHFYEKHVGLIPSLPWMGTNQVEIQKCLCPSDIK